LLLYSFGAVGECLFQLNIAANPADRFYCDIIINGGGPDGVLQGLGQSRTHAGQLTVGALVAQDIAVVPMLVFAQPGIDVLQQWPLLLVRVVIALVILAALLVWIGKTARQRLPMATLLEGNVELAILFSLGICFLAASLTGYIGLSPVFGAFCAGLALAHTNLRKAVWMRFSRCNRYCLWCFSSRLGGL
jgi:Kef-type K+ transport system membrane component KefB